MGNAKNIIGVTFFTGIMAILAIWAIAPYAIAGNGDTATTPANGGINNSSYSGGNTQNVTVKVTVNCCCQQQPCPPCAEGAAAGGEVTFEVTPETPPGEAPPAGGKTEQSVFEFEYDPDSYNEVIDNSDQTQAIPSGSWNETSTTGSQTPDDW